MTRASTRIAQKAWALMGMGVACLLAAVLVPDALASLALYAMGATLLGLMLLSVVSVRLHRREKGRALAAVAGFVEHDSAAGFVTDADGAILYCNDAATERFLQKQSGQNQSAQKQSMTLAGVLGDVFASPGAVLFRLQTKAQAHGAAREDIVTRRGHVRLSVHTLVGGGFLWRIEEMGERPAVGRKPDASALPMITSGRNGAVLFMNESARRLIGERVKSLDRLFPEMPVRAGDINAISTTSGRVDTMVAEIEGSAGRREIFFFPVAGEKSGNRNGWGFFDELPVPMLKLSPSGEVLLSNRDARRLLGRDDCDGLRLSDLMEGLGRSISDWLGEAASGRGLSHAEFLRLTRTDREQFVQIVPKRVLEAGQPVLIAVLNDATELKTLEAQFVQSQKMQAIGELAGGVAHDFNNLLTAISGHCDLLLLRHDQGDADYSDLMQVAENANRAASLVGQLLAFSRKQTLRPEVIDMRDTLSDMTHLLNRLVGEKVTLTLSHDPVLKMIRADKRQLEQVLMNLVVNARDAMSGGGEIRIETETVTLQDKLERDRAVVPQGDYVTVKVEDEGCGIPQDKLQKVFEPFFTTKRTGEGTGLGLSTVYGIVKQSGAFIFVDSVVGQGTCFTLYFPVHVPAHVENIAQAIEVKKPAAKHGDGVVLLVEDEAPVRAFASRALRLRGYTVIEADSAEEALKMLEDQELNIDIFVTDVVMPGMDGPTWVQEALKVRPDVRVVFVSGYAEDSFGDAQQRIPNSVFLPKPFSLSDLTETVQRQLH
ncbi:MAG: ATP-binding protein [Paracoccaceae bacterium]